MFKMFVGFAYLRALPQWGGTLRRRPVTPQDTQLLTSYTAPSQGQQHYVSQRLVRKNAAPPR